MTQLLLINRLDTLYEAHVPFSRLYIYILFEEFQFMAIQRILALGYPSLQTYFVCNKLKFDRKTYAVVKYQSGD